MAGMMVGQTMKVKGPKGAMVYMPNMVSHFGMIAGGTGITPMLQIIRAIVRGRPRNGGTDATTVSLIFANVNVEDILLKDDLDALAEEDDRLSVYYVLNNPPAGWTGGEGFVSESMIKVILCPILMILGYFPLLRLTILFFLQERLSPPANDVKLLICGPPPMVSAMKKLTHGIGYEKARPVSKLEDQVFCF